LLPPVCPGCGRPQTNGVLCSVCRQRQPQIDGIRSPFCFDGVMRQAIHQLKYKNLKALSPHLAGLLAEYLDANPMPGDIIIPVPLHPAKLRERGYNQSELLAQELSKIVKLPVLGKGLVRSKNTPPQVKAKNVEERRENVTGAFTCQVSTVKGKAVILIDDVCTSGATMEACAAALKNHDVASVWGLTLARETQ